MGLITFPASLGQKAYAEKTDAAQTAITTVIDISNLSALTFTVLAGETWEVELVCPWNTVDTTGGILFVYITDAADSIKATAASASARANAANVGPVRATERITAAGSYTRKGRAQGSAGAGTIQAGTSAPSPVFIKATRVA